MESIPSRRPFQPPVRCRCRSRATAIVAAVLIAAAAAPRSALAADEANAALAETMQQAYATSKAELARGDLEAAVRHMTRALELADRDLPAGDAQIGILAFNLGRLELELGRNAAAADHLARAVEVYGAVHGRDAPELLPVLGSRADALERAGEPDAAYPVRERILAITKKANGKESVEVADALVALARFESANGKARTANSHLKRAQRIWKKQRGRDSIEAGTVTFYLGMSELAAGDLTSGLRDIQKGVEIMEAALPDGDPRKVQMYTMLLPIAGQMRTVPGAPWSDAFDADRVRAKLESNRALAAAGDASDRAVTAASE